jgi:hypothetical protein
MTDSWSSWMHDHDKPKNEWDDLDIYDREAADIRRNLRKIDLKQWVQDLYSLDPDLFDNMQKLITLASNRRR